MHLNCEKEKECRDKSDEEIAVLARKNKECYVCLMQRYEDKIFRYIKRISGVRDEIAQDIAQEIFLKVYINLNNFNQRMKFSSWIYRIAHNETINYWRCNNKKENMKISWDDNEALKNIIKDNYNTEQEVYQKITHQELLKALNNLEEKYREAIVLSYLEGKSYQEIADIMKKPIGTIGTLINRAKLKLKKELEKYGIIKRNAQFK